MSSAAPTAAPLRGPGALEAPEPARFRAALGRFVTGVTVLTATVDGVPHGSTANAFSSLSLDPPLALACLQRGSRLLDRIVVAQAFAVNVLRDDQAHLARHFASRGRPEGVRAFAGTGWTASPLGSPLLPGAIAQLDCVLHATADGGDHVICVGRVEGLATHAGAPLLFRDGAFARIGDWLGQAAVPEAWPWI